MREGALKRQAFAVAAGTGLVALSEKVVTGTTILAYHGVTGRAAGPLRNLRRLHVPSGLFGQHLSLLRSRWNPISLSALAEAIRDGRRLPRRSVVVTLDDGYRNVLTEAAPLLARHGVPATVFVITRDRPRRLWRDRLEAALEATSLERVAWRGRELGLDTVARRAAAAAELECAIGALRGDHESEADDVIAALGCPPRRPDEDRDLLGWDEIRALRRSGIDIGSHADVHQTLTSRGPEIVAEALRQSIQRLETELGPGRYALSYPFGAYDDGIREAARAAGFSCAVTGDPGRNDVGTDLFALRRMLIGADDETVRLRATLSGLRGAFAARPDWRAS